MGLCYYFYKNIDKSKHSSQWNEIDSGKYCGIPNSIEKYGATRIKPECAGCEHEANKDSNDFILSFPCMECWGDHTTYLITREQAQKIQKDMDCNKTLFTDLMDSINQDYIYMEYNY